MILCKCGCGKELTKGYYNSYDYIFGHAPDKTYDLNLVCECGCGELLPDDSLDKYIYKRGHKLRKKGETTICACGCGQKIAWSSTWVNGHSQQKYINLDPTPCLCGCGQLVKPPLTYINGHHNKCKLNQDKRKQSMLKYYNDPKWKKKISNSYYRFYNSLSSEEKYKLNENSRKALKDPKVRKKISDANRKKWQDPVYIEKMSGVNHCNWKGGSSKEPYCNEFIEPYKEEIREWDNYECRNPYCRGTAVRLAVHHIDYNKMHCHFMNLISVCTSCNIRANTHTKYWKRLYKRIRRYGFHKQCMFEFGA